MDAKLEHAMLLINQTPTLRDNPLMFSNPGVLHQLVLMLVTLGLHPTDNAFKSLIELTYFVKYREPKFVVRFLKAWATMFMNLFSEKASIECTLERTANFLKERADTVDAPNDLVVAVQKTPMFKIRIDKFINF